LGPSNHMQFVSPTTHGVGATRACARVLSLGSLLISCPASPNACQTIGRQLFNWQFGPSWHVFGFFSPAKVRHFHTFVDIILGSPCRKMAAALKVQNDFDTASRKFDMPSGSRTLLARKLLLANLQPAQTGIAMRSYSKKR
jgi:hypothetical protein